MAEHTVAPSNVTPIRAASAQPPTTPAKPSRRRRKGSVLELRDDLDGEGFGTLHVIAGLRGVCYALDHLVDAGTAHSERLHELATAARVLSAMVAERVA